MVLCGRGGERVRTGLRLEEDCGISCVSDLRFIPGCESSKRSLVDVGFESSCGRNVAKIFDAIPKWASMGLGFFLTQILELVLMRERGELLEDSIKLYDTTSDRERVFSISRGTEQS